MPTNAKVAAFVSLTAVGMTMGPVTEKKTARLTILLRNIFERRSGLTKYKCFYLTDSFNNTAFDVILLIGVY